MLAMRMRPRTEPGGNPPPSPDSTLPADLAACIEAASVYPRHAGAEGDVRAIVQLDGQGWVHDDETTRTQLLRRWPELQPAQLRRAVRHIGAKVRQACAPSRTERRHWMNDF